MSLTKRKSCRRSLAELPASQLLLTSHLGVSAIELTISLTMLSKMNDKLPNTDQQEEIARRSRRTLLSIFKDPIDTGSQPEGLHPLST
jgi:hypothetical protein